jgi:hypothetical protein
MNKGGILAIIGGILIIVAMFLPWWIVDDEEYNYYAHIDYKEYWEMEGEVDAFGNYEIEETINGVTDSDSGTFDDWPIFGILILIMGILVVISAVVGMLKSKSPNNRGRCIPLGVMTLIFAILATVFGALLRLHVAMPDEIKERLEDFYVGVGPPLALAGVIMSIIGGILLMWTPKPKDAKGPPADEYHYETDYQE